MATVGTPGPPLLVEAEGQEQGGGESPGCREFTRQWGGERASLSHLPLPAENGQRETLQPTFRQGRKMGKKDGGFSGLSQVTWVWSSSQKWV